MFRLSKFLGIGTFLVLAASPLASHAVTATSATRGDPDAAADVAAGGGKLGVAHKLEVAGQGATNLGLTASTAPNCKAVGLTCATGDTCQCLETKGTALGFPHFGKGTFDLLMLVDLTKSITQGTEQCFPTAAVDTLVRKNKDQLTLQVSGIACNTPDVALGLFNGSWGIEPGAGTGGFIESMGTGTLSWSDLFSTSRTQVHVEGHINFNP